MSHYKAPAKGDTPSHRCQMPHCACCLASLPSSNLRNERPGNNKAVQF